MHEKQVTFVAFQEQDNLGVGYLGAVLMQAGFKIGIIDFRTEKEVILNKLLADMPLAVGFSIIFQYHIQEFKDLIQYLRSNGVDCHFTAGGHYPSLRYHELMQFMPGIDSVVLFEGEQTFLELVQTLSRNENWENINGLASRSNGGPIKANSLRPLVTDLDQFPPPVRPPLKTYALGKKYATLIASRGCLYDCSYCSIREFYAKPEGKLKRYRKPEWVVKEMELLYYEKNCHLFMFQDDDFPISGPNAKEWTNKFCDLLEESGLGQNIMFKMNCRPDEIDPDVFHRLINNGLFLVYIGLESGTDEGLRLMNKHTTAVTNLEAVASLKQLGVLFDYGFMLFYPTSSFNSILADLDFLARIGSDGSSPITFCKMLPYAGTRIERMLMEQGRLMGTQGFMNYRFMDPAIDIFYEIVFDCFESWISDHDGLLNLATWVRYYIAVLHKFHHPGADFSYIEDRARQIIAESNAFLLETLNRLCHRVKSCVPPPMDDTEIKIAKTQVQQAQKHYETEIKHLMERIETLASNH